MANGRPSRKSGNGYGKLRSMPTEIEKKYRLTGGRRTEIESELRRQGAEYAGEEFEENTIFSNDSLRAAGGIVRIRRVGETTLLTYKRRVENQFDVKEQIEHETEVRDAGSIRSILTELGLGPVLIYEKRRSTWKFRSVEVVFDELAFGSFMEIEGSVTGIREAELLLGIDDLETVHETYPSLTAQFGSRSNGIIESRFQKNSP